MYLGGRLRSGSSEREYHYSAMAYSPNSCKSQDWAQVKPRPRTSSSIYNYKNEIRSIYLTKHKNQLKTDLRPNLRPETIKLLEENVGETLQEINVGDDFFKKSHIAQATKAKLNNWDSVGFTQQRK